ncbi:MAG: hypothetical protein AAF587_05075 [Bacteroidota bacterium]
MVRQIVQICLFGCLYLPTMAQDFTLEHLALLPHYRTELETPPPDARINLYCDGNNLTLVAEVIDDNIYISESSEATDHIEIWFALPRSAYPDDFEYRKHPDYIYAPGMPSRGDWEPEGRLFSIYGEYTDWLDVDSFQLNYDYPDEVSVLEDSLLVPVPQILSQTQLPFGVIGFALYPDQRPAEILFPEAYQQLEDVLGFRLGDWTKGVTYTAEIDENGPGYQINAEISPLSLGFLPLPDLRETGFLVEIADHHPRSGIASVVRSSAPEREIARPSSFNQVYLSTPLYTNYSGISDAFFYEEDWDGMMVLAEDNWEFVSVEADALVYQPEESSQSLMEVSFHRLFLNQRFQYPYELQMEVLEFQKDYINAQSQLEHQFLIDHQFFRTRHIPTVPYPFVDSMFVFPDGSPGLILHGHTPLSPYGWGDCGDCVEESYRIFRIVAGGSFELLRIEQSSAAPYFCEIGEEHSYANYAVESFDWIYPGEILVFRLSHRTEPKDKKRVKVSWEADGSGVLVEEL